MKLLPNLNRRNILPFLYSNNFIVMCFLLLIKSKKFYFNKIFIFSYSFLLLFIYRVSHSRYTGLSQFMKVFYIIFPIILTCLFYLFLKNKFSSEAKKMNKVLLNYLLINFLKTFFSIISIFIALA